MKKLAALLVTAAIATQAYSQEEQPKTSPITLSGYIEAYYAYDFSRPTNNTRPEFFYSYNRHNEVNINLAYVRAAYATDRVRANVGFMAGTYSNANLANEPGVLKNIWEANAGVKLSESKNLWIDAGILSSHIGLETAVGKDCWALTRSLQAEMSPYFESGARLSYTSANEKWYMAALVLNGWQRIRRPDGNSTPAFGTQVTFKPNSKVTLNSSTFIGSDKPDSARQMRYFHDLYAIVQLTKKFGVTAGLDYGVEQKTPGSNAVNPWLTSQLIARLALSSKLTLALRGEYIRDTRGVIISIPTPHGFQTTAVSTNLDYQITPNAVWRIELRSFHSQNPTYTTRTDISRNNTTVTTALAVSF